MAYSYVLYISKQLFLNYKYLDYKTDIDKQKESLFLVKVFYMTLFDRMPALYKVLKTVRNSESPNLFLPRWAQPTGFQGSFLSNLPDLILVPFYSSSTLLAISPSSVS